MFELQFYDNAQGRKLYRRRLRIGRPRIRSLSRTTRHYRSSFPRHSIDHSDEEDSPVVFHPPHRSHRTRLHPRPHLLHSSKTASPT